MSALVDKVNNLLAQFTDDELKRDQPDKPDNADEEMEDEDKMVVTEQGVSGKVDYGKLCKQFGCDLLTDDMIVKMEKLTGKRVHPMIRRKLYYAHRDFDKILDCYAKGKPFYLYTGRGTVFSTFIFAESTEMSPRKFLSDFPLIFVLK